MPLAFSLKGLPSTSSSAARTVIVSIAKVVNPLGTVTTLTQSVTSDSDLDYGCAGDGDEFMIHENCDEALFRPVVAVFGGSIGKSEDECHERPNDIGQELIVPVIEKKNAESRTKTAKENAVVNATDNKACGPSKKDALKKELEEKVKEPEKKERKKSDTKQPKLEVKVSGKKSDKTRKESVGRADDAVEATSTNKCDKGMKAKQESEVETTNSTEPETVLIKLPKKGQKKGIKTEEQKRETTPPKSDEIYVSKTKSDDIGVSKTKSRKNNAKQTEPATEAISRNEEAKPITVKENEQVKTPEESKLKMGPSNIEIPISASTQEELKINDEEAAKPIPQERGSKKQKKMDKGGLCQWPKVDSQPMPINVNSSEEVVTLVSKESSDCSKSYDDENEISFTIDKRCKNKKKIEKASRDTVKPNDEWAKLPTAKETKQPYDEIDANVSANTGTDKFEENTDTVIDYMEILNEELRSMKTDCSNIQESLFKDPVVTTTFTVKKPVKKPSFTDVLNDSAAETSSSVKPVDYDITNMESFSDVFAPLKPFDIDFEQLTFKDTSDEPISLINFESPSQDSGAISTKRTITPTIDYTDKEKLVFALCGSLHCNDDDDDDDALPPPPPITAPPLEGQDSDYKSLELDIDETYLSFELPAPLDTTKDVEVNSSDDSEDSSSQCKVSKDDDDVKYKAGMDEELVPLIGLTISSEHFDVAKEDEALPVEEEDEPTNQIDALKQIQQMPEKQGFGNKKKSKKKRR